VHQTKNIQSISIIGLGNVGWHLALSLKQAGYEIKNIVSRNSESVSAPGEIPNTTIISDINQIRDEPDLYLITVQDSEIASLAASLRGSDSIIVHTSGGIDMSVFSGKSASYGVFYPLQTFTKGTDMTYSDIPFLLEADSEDTLSVLKNVAEKISGKYRCVEAEERLSLHLAAVFACNFSNHMVSIASYLLKKENLDLELIQPLMKQTLKKLETLSPKEAQTGPAIRNDMNTMNRHLELLADEPGLEDLYKIISKSIQNNKL
jgi:predicted short-subunit dehydrogenase-like oxidoreductase (DUF2520 family)